MMAVAIKVTKENLSVIASEAGKHYTREQIEGWLTDHHSGYFIRDDSSAFDCQMMVDNVFFGIYMFMHDDESNLFRRIIKL